MADLNDLKDKAIKGSLWSIVEKFILYFVQLIVSIVLARLLDPKDYGLIAITMIFVSISAALTDGGFEKTLIHEKVLNSIEINTVFYLNTILGLLITLTLILFSNKIAIFFEDLRLAAVLRLVSFSILLNSLGQVQSILLRKELQFKKLSYAQMIASLIGGILGVVLAYAGWGVWALAISIVSTQFIILCLYWYKAPWYPKLEWSYQSIKPMIGYGSNILFSSVLSFVIQQFNTFIVGKYYSKADLGLFNRGNRFPELVINTVEGVVHKTSFPVFSKLQDDNHTLKKAFEKSMRMVAFISLPLLVLLYVNAEDLTIVLFTEKWAGSIIFLQLFCIVKSIHPFIGIFKEIMLAKGHASALTRITSIASFIEIGIVTMAVNFNLTYVVFAVGISTVIQYVMYSKFLFKRIDLSWVAHLKWVLPYVLISAAIIIMHFVSDAILSQFHTTQVIKLVLNLSIGGISFVLCLLIGNLRELEYVKYVYDMFKSKILRFA